MTCKCRLFLPQASITLIYHRTIRNDEGNQAHIAHLDFICWAVEQPGEGADAEPEIGFFINLPPGNRVTVNGRTFEYTLPEDFIEGGETPLFIMGPLNMYTTVELLSQPIFFFRRLVDLDFQNKGDKVRHRPSREEIALRDTNGNVSANNIKITWTQLVSPEPGLLLKTGKEEGHRQENRKTWTNANGQVIEDPYLYLSETIPSLERLNLNDVLPRVLASINNGQDRSMASVSMWGK